MHPLRTIASLQHVYRSPRMHDLCVAQPGLAGEARKPPSDPRATSIRLWRLKHLAIPTCWRLQHLCSPTLLAGPKPTPAARTIASLPATISTSLRSPSDFELSRTMPAKLKMAPPGYTGSHVAFDVSCLRQHAEQPGLRVAKQWLGARGKNRT
eukprot:250254-Chlamydomonas_euryale.AAC.7